MTEPSEKHLKEIDCLKGIAIIAVVCIHSKFLDGAFFYDWGINRAVPVFLVLLGMTLDFSLSKPSTSSGLARLRTFYLARFKRLYPPFWAMGLAWWVFAILIAGVRPERRIPEILLTLTGFAPWIGTTWFVMVVLQLVLLFPALRWLYGRVGPYVLLLPTWFLCAFSVWHVFDIVLAGHKLYTDPTRPVDFYYQWIFGPRVFWNLVAGLWLARELRKYGYKPAIVAAILLLLEPFVIGLVRLDDPWTLKEQIVLYTFDVPLTIALLGFLRWVTLPGAVERFLTWCGRASWGIYLGHILVFETVHLLGHAPELGSQPQRAVYFLGLFAAGAVLTIVADGMRRRLWTLRSLPQGAATS